MKESPSLPSVFLALVAIILSFIVFSETRANRDLERRNGMMSEQLIGLSGKVVKFEERNEELRRDLEGTKSELESLNHRLAEYEEAPGADGGEAPDPFQARVFLGNEYMGPAWVVYATDRVSGREKGVKYRPVIRLDESMRNHFTEVRTNHVERPVFHESNVYNTPAQYAGYLGGYPYYYGRRFLFYPSRPAHPAPPAPPANGGGDGGDGDTPRVVLPPGGGGPWTPVTNPGIRAPMAPQAPSARRSVRRQTLGTPASTIQTTPPSRVPGI